MTDICPLRCSETEAETESEPESEIESETGSETEPENKPEIRSEIKSEIESDPGPGKEYRMTILQLKYVIEVASAPSIREAARRLFVSQPALSSSIRELEEELGFRIFERNNRGIFLTAKGTEFIQYAKKAANQYEIVEHRYIKSAEDREVFSVSMQHYVFAVHAFMETIKSRMNSRYSFT